MCRIYTVGLMWVIYNTIFVKEKTSIILQLYFSTFQLNFIFIVENVLLVSTGPRQISLLRSNEVIVESTHYRVVVELNIWFLKGPCGSFVECKTGFDPNFAKPSSRHRVDQFGSKWICK